MELPPVETLGLDTSRDTLYDYPKATHKTLNDTKPWLKDPYYFKTVRISAVALTKMVMHARSGGSLEVMGLMTGYACPPTATSPANVVVTDSFRIPVEGTETRVNAQDDANEYIVEYLKDSREGDISNEENVVGWYHSHPGYGCWLSGIDVATQALQQQFNEPFVAVVVDPDRTVSANKVEIGAFRTFPADFHPTASSSADGGAVPLAKAEDFGAHASRYYSLEVEHFKSGLDAGLLESLWNKYWVQTLAQNPLLTNREYSAGQMLDLASKTGEISGAIRRGAGRGVGGQAVAKNPVDRSLEKMVQDVKSVAAKEKAGLMATELRANVFTCGCNPSRSQGGQQ
ncbi:JAB1/Mov34/MPN/PAD-1 ubiquitin protease domain containing protein [Rhypophila decipiens]